jgi:hypothetical protein
MGEKLTKAQRRHLEWFAARKFAFVFGRGDPPLYAVKRLRDAGLVQVVGHEPGAFGFTRYAITDAGRALLKDQPQ